MTNDWLMHYLSLTRDLLYLLSVVDKWMTDALPVAVKRLTLFTTWSWQMTDRCTTYRWPEIDLCTICSCQMTDFCTTTSDWLMDYLYLTNDWLMHYLSLTRDSGTLFSICSWQMTDWCTTCRWQEAYFIFLSVVEKCLTDALPVADKRFTLCTICSCHLSNTDSK